MNNLQAIIKNQSLNLENDIQKKIDYLKSDTVFSTYKRYIDETYVSQPAEKDEDFANAFGLDIQSGINKKVHETSEPQLEASDKRRFTDRIAMLRGLSSTASDFSRKI